MSVMEYSPSFSIDAGYDLLIGRALPRLFSTLPLVGVPVREEVAERLSPHADWLVDRARQGIDDTLVIAPRIGGDGIGAAQLVWGHDPNTYVDYGYWPNQKGETHFYGNYDVVHDNGLEADWDVAVMLNDLIDPRKNVATVDRGLVHAGLSVESQRIAFDDEKWQHAQAGRELVSATAAQLVVEFLVMKAAGKQRRDSTTRLIHYPERQDGIPEVSCHTDRRDDRLAFRGSHVANQSRDVGVRCALRV